MVTHDKFDIFLKRMVDSTYNTLAAKASEYSLNDDRMHNFHVSRTLQSLVHVNTEVSAAWNLASKQLASVIDMINNVDKAYDKNRITEKIGDSINYLLLIGAMIEDRLDYLPFGGIQDGYNC